MRSLPFFACVSWGIFPSTNLVDSAENRHTSISFCSLLFFYISSFWDLEICSYLLCFFCSFLCSFLLSILSILQLLSTLLSLLVQLIFWFPLLSSFQICSPFFSPFLLFYCFCFSVMFYYYSIWLLSVIHHLFRALCLILFCYIFYSCFCFLYTSSFWFGFNYTFCSVPFCLSLFSVYSLSFLFYASFFLLFLFLLFFCSLLFSLLFATPFLNVNFFLHSDPFVFTFIFIFICFF